jgi:hypothetical protein
MCSRMIRGRVTIRFTIDQDGTTDSGPRHSGFGRYGKCDIWEKPISERTIIYFEGEDFKNFKESYRIGRLVCDYRRDHAR